jgi:hypothetical protein
MNFFFALTIAGSVVLARAQRATVRALSTRPMPTRPRRALRFWVLTTVVGMIGVAYTLVAAWPALLLLQGAVAARAAGLRRRRFLRFWLLASLIAWVAAAPLVFALWSSVARFSRHYWTAATAKTFGSQVAELLDSLFGMSVVHDPSVFLPETLNTIAGVSIVILGIYAAIRHRRRPATIIASAVGFGLPLVLVAISAVQSVLIPRYYLLSLLCVSVLAADGAVLLWRGPRAKIIPIVLGAGVVLQGLDTAVAERNYRWTNIGAYFQDRGIDEITGFTMTIWPTEMVRRYLSTMVSTRTTALGNNRISPENLAAALASTPAIWVFDYRAAKPIDDALPAGTIACRWEALSARVTLLARSTESIPARLAGCAGSVQKIR